MASEPLTNVIREIDNLWEEVLNLNHGVAAEVLRSAKIHLQQNPPQIAEARSRLKAVRRLLLAAAGYEDAAADILRLLELQSMQVS